jgi:hypothetical protein
MRELERCRIEQRYGAYRLARGAHEETWSGTRNRPREQPLCASQTETRATQQVDDGRPARWLGADGRDHVAATAEVGVGNEQAEKVRLITQSLPSGAEAVVPRDSDDVPAELIDDTPRVRNPFTIRRRGSFRAATGDERSGNEHDDGFSKHPADDHRRHGRRRNRQFLSLFVIDR